MPIRIAPVTSFNSAQRPVSSSSSSQRVSCFGSSVLPRVRSVVTTSVRVGGGGLLWRFDPFSIADGTGSLPLPLAGAVGSPGGAFALSDDPGGGFFSGTADAACPHPNPPPQAGEGAERVVAGAAFDFLRGGRAELCAAPSPPVGEGWGEGWPSNELSRSIAVLGHISATVSDRSPT